MEMNRTARRNVLLQSWLFAILLLVIVGLVAWLGTRYHFEMDWTASGRHTLSESTVQMLQSLDETNGPITITAFTRQQGEQGVRLRISELVGRYQQITPTLLLAFVDPDQDPQQVRQEGITLDGEMLIQYQGRKEHLKTIGEQALTNALQRLARSGERKIAFLTGHGEQSFDGSANHDLSRWAEQLIQKGFQFIALNLSSTLTIPTDIALLVIASPQSALLSGEVKIIREYLSSGGNLLWLHDPNDSSTLELTISQDLGIRFNSGTIVDPTGEQLGIENPAIIVVPDYPVHAVSSGLTTMTLFPLAHAIELSNEMSEWQKTPILQSLERSWSEHQPLQGTIQFDAESDQQGPLTLGLLLERAVTQNRADSAAKSQRIAVIGDGDFISNAYLGNGANRELGERLLNWLSFDDELITIPPKVAPDIHLALTPNLAILFGFGFLLVIPGALLGSGLWIWHRRRQR